MQRLDFGVESLDEDGESWRSVREIFLAAKRRKQAWKQQACYVLLSYQITDCSMNIKPIL